MEPTCSNRTRALAMTLFTLPALAGCVELPVNDAPGGDVARLAGPRADSAVDRLVEREVRLNFTGTVTGTTGLEVPQRLGWEDKPGRAAEDVRLPGDLVRGRFVATWSTQSLMVAEVSVELRCFLEEGGSCGPPNPLLGAKGRSSPLRDARDPIPALRDDGRLYFEIVAHGQDPGNTSPRTSYRIEATLIVLETARA